MDYSEDVISRFWAKVDKRGPDECWPWLGATNPKWYGNFRIAGHCLGTHRVAYAVSVGPVPKGRHILHSCDNPPCCNPSHLWDGTNLDNMRDKKTKGRHKSRGARLVAEEVREIRSRLSKGESDASVARAFALNPSTVTRIKSRKYWNHIAP